MSYTSRGLKYDKQKLAADERRRREVQAVYDKTAKQLKDDNLTPHMRAGTAQAHKEAGEELRRLTAEILHLRKMINRAESKV